MNYKETILVSLNLSSSWQNIRPSYPKIPISITVVMKTLATQGMGLGARAIANQLNTLVDTNGHCAGPRVERWPRIQHVFPFHYELVCMLHERQLAAHLGSNPELLTPD